MKKGILLLKLFIICNTCLSQNWNLLNENFIANYSTSNSGVVTNSLWIDSSQISGDTSFYYLNRVSSYCNTCDWPNLFLDDQSQFLGKVIIQTSNKILFGIGTQKVIFPNNSIDETWQYDELNNISAWISSIEIDSIFGQVDSIKTITLSNDKQLKLSKEFGIIQFPQWNDLEDLILVGIDNEGLGQLVPKFRDYFDFAVGDVFEYLSSYWVLELVNDQTRIKKEVLSKEYLGDTIKYEFKVVSRANPEGIIITEYFIDSANHVTNSYPGELITIQNREFCGKSFTFDYYFEINTPIIDENEVLGMETNYFEIPVYHFSVQDTFADLAYLTHGYKVGLGETILEASYFESSEGWRLVGYVKGQDTIGTVTPDDIFVSTIEIREPFDIDIFPNPSKDILNIKVENNEHINKKAELEIVNLMGEVVLKNRIYLESSEINVSSLSAGIYFVKITKGNKENVQKICIQ